MLQGVYDMRKIKIFIILMMLSAMFCFAACSSETKDPADTRPEIARFEPLNTITEGGRNIYLIVKLMDSSYWQVIINGAKDAGEAYGVNIYCGGTNIETDWQGQRQLIDEALEAGADAILLAPDDSVELTPDIEKVHNKGIPVILIDTAANTDSFDICYMTDNLLAGQNAAREMLHQLHDAGHSEDSGLCVGIMVGQSTSQTINERLAGFFEYWSDNAPEKWIISTDIMNCNGNIDLGEQLAADFLEKHPDTAGLFGTNNGPTRALCRALVKKERNDPVIVGFDYSNEIKSLIGSSDYRASTMLQRQYDMSYKGVATALELLDGNKPGIKFEDTGVITVNKDTLADPDVEEVLKNN